MLVLVGFILLILMIGIGFFRTHKRLKSEEYGMFSLIKWTFFELACIGICSFIEVSKGGNGDKTALLVVTIIFLIGVIASFIIEKICIRK
ncbi:MAG: hypothetical protein HFJ50_00905 [Clostridia bacterium]|jgi:hypothetical protein|nr:hypothetical protein [Clostridia bacterium]